MTKETKTIIIRLGLAILLIIAVGLLINYMNPKEDTEAKKAVNDQIEKKSDFVLTIPKIKKDNDTKDLTTMKNKAKEIHEQMNAIENQDGFNGASLEDKDITKRLKEVDQKLESVKREKNNTPEFNAHIEHMQELVGASLDGSARALASLYGYVSGLDQKLNEAKAVADVIDISDYLTNIKNDSTLVNVEKWVNQVQTDIDSGKLNDLTNKDYGMDAKEKRDEASQYLKDTKEQADKYMNKAESEKIQQQLEQLRKQLEDIQSKKTTDTKQLENLKETLEKIKRYNNK